MAYTTIKKPSDYFNTKLYTGTGSAGQTQTGVGFQPDLVWTKSRSNAYPHQWYDIIRGVTKRIQSNDTSAEATQSNGLTSFDSDGFTVGDASGTGVNNATYASWNWLANGAGVANTDGTISSTVSANTTSGFSIVSYTGNATAGATVGHGLGSTPSMIIIKVRSTANNWGVYHKSMGATKAMYLDGTSGETTDGWLNNTAPDSSVFTLSGGNYGNTNGNTHIAYCFAEKQGFSKFGSYTGNGSTDGTFVYTGFKPAWVMIKRTNAATPWCMWDNKRNTFNLTQNYLYANDAGAEGSGASIDMDMLSNGFKLKNSSSFLNTSGDSFIYMAFASEPLIGDNPATAR
jgi:hypothetical protein